MGIRDVFEHRIRRYMWKYFYKMNPAMCISHQTLEEGQALGNLVAEGKFVHEGHWEKCRRARNEKQRID